VSSRAGQEDAGQQAYFRLSQTDWAAVLPAMRERLTGLRERLDAVLAVGGPSAAAPGPADLALQLGEVASETFELLAPEERELRQIITTLRTALALCCDLYSVDEARRTSVQALMQRLQADISSFEAELQQVQSGDVPDDSSSG